MLLTTKKETINNNDNHYYLEKILKYSKQRDSILKTLQENVVHPTADFIYAKAKEENPNISLATVYRNLNQLAENGDIKKISGLDNMTHFDHNTHKHFHFIFSIHALKYKITIVSE